MMKNIDLSLDSDDGNVPLFHSMAQNIRDEGYRVQTNVLSTELGQQLYNEIREIPKYQFNMAEIGRNENQLLNRHLLLGLFSFESHFTHYRAGDFYKQHQDAFKGQANRILSLVVYLIPIGNLMMVASCLFTLMNLKTR